MLVKTMSGNRRAGGGLGLACVAVCLATLALAGSAHAAVTVHPAGGSSFDTGAEGWVGSGTSCNLVLLCTATNVHDPVVGNGGGSIATDVNYVTAIGVLTGGGTWTSPAFAVPAEGSVTGASFSYDRRFDAGGLIDVAPQSTVVVSLVDETAGTSAPVLTDVLTDEDSTFASSSAPAAVTAGHAYRIEIATTTTATLGIGLTGSSRTSFDNVSLSVVSSSPAGGGGGDADGDAEGGPGGADVSPGATIVRRSYGDSEIAGILGRFDVDAATGSGRDGSLVPLELCTIVGTSGPDRITGTSGNDVICGLGGDDVIDGAGGRDVVDGANGRDRLSGSLGGDLLLGLAGNDRLEGGGDADRVGGGAGNDRVDGGAGRDLVSGSSGNDGVNGSAGNDVLRGLGGRDRLNGGPNADRLAGGAGNDVLRGQSGFDRMAGGPGADRFSIRDGRRDAAIGGGGHDRAVADAVDRLRVEVARRGPPPR